MKPKKKDIYCTASGLLKLVLVSIVSLFLGMTSSMKTFSNKKPTIEEKQKFEGTETTKYSRNVSLDFLESQDKIEETEFEEIVTFNDSYNLSWSDFLYLVTLEKDYRDENPFATPDEVGHFLNNELNELILNNQNFLVPMDSGSGTYEIFGISLTSQELLLFASFPVQAVQAYNASRDSVSKGEELYINSNSDHRNPNAFRHGYWNALMEKRISKDYLKKVVVYPYPPMYIPVQYDFAKMFADAHEYGTSGLGTDMDYLNNALGREHGSTYKNFNDHDMAIEMTKRIVNGEFYRIVENEIVPTNWEELKPQYLYTTSPVSGGVSIIGVSYSISGVIELPHQIQEQTVVAIGNSALANQTRLTKITIPGSVTTIGSNTFLNTGGSSIYIQDKTVAPSAFHYNWNPSTNPVYLNGVLCNHSTATLKNLSATVHGIMCPKCRTTTNIQNHAHIHNYTWTNYKQHRGTCECGVFKQMGHVVSSGDTGFPYKTCLHCGGPVDTGFVINGLTSFILSSNSVTATYSFGVGSYVLSNGVIVLSEIDTENYLNGALVLPDIGECLDCHEHEDDHDYTHAEKCCS